MPKNPKKKGSRLFKAEVQATITLLTLIDNTDKTFQNILNQLDSKFDINQIVEYLNNVEEKKRIIKLKKNF